MSMDKKIIPFAELSSYISKIRGKKDSVVVLCHGCFDIVHPGHIRHLKFAKDQGSHLIVTITPDICIQKGSSRPLVPQDLRAENLAALEFVSAVSIATGETGIEPITAVKPDIYVKGSEYAVSKDHRFLKEKDLVEEFGGNVVYSSGDVVFSSTEFIRDYEMSGAETEKLHYICGRYQITRENIESIFKKATGKNVLVIGDITVEEFHYCDGLGISQDFPVMSIALKNKSDSIGGAGSIAMHLAGIGVKTSVISCMNPASDKFPFISYSFSDASVQLINIEDKHRQIPSKMRFFVDKKPVLEMEKGSGRPLDSTVRKQFLAAVKKEIKKNPDCIILSDFGYGLLSEDLTGEIISTAKKQNVPVIADMGFSLKTRLEKFYKSDLLTSTEMELRACMHDYESGLSVLVDRFYQISGISHLFMMLADGGTLYFKASPNPGTGISNMESVHVPDMLKFKDIRAGGGEAYVAGIASAHISQASPAQTLYAGALFTAAYQKSPYIKPLHYDDLVRILDERKELKK